jgi:hypothetical protein
VSAQFIETTDAAGANRRSLPSRQTVIVPAPMIEHSPRAGSIVQAVCSSIPRTATPGSSIAASRSKRCRPDVAATRIVCRALGVIPVRHDRQADACWSEHIEAVEPVEVVAGLVDLAYRQRARAQGSTPRRWHRTCAPAETARDEFEHRRVAQEARRTMGCPGRQM